MKVPNFHKLGKCHASVHPEWKKDWRCPSNSHGLRWEEVNSLRRGELDTQFPKTMDVLSYKNVQIKMMLLRYSIIGKTLLLLLLLTYAYWLLVRMNLFCARHFMNFAMTKRSKTWTWSMLYPGPWEQWHYWVISWGSVSGFCVQERAH